ncbi:sensor histidine kinase KdpD [Magnetospira sp. QH-2]|uniref:sensor histidine kinase n=1 Tax=Magnetospira sp. (strain QH-2) TaxID=1288970 RepID=UPI0003E80F17|nr:HAMP domain-containing sensor histidine kinase [Magnetospira sp. QH-2]CCQ74698.1 putative Histidine kinase [Magnetospira sp. QH-2]
MAVDPAMVLSRVRHDLRQPLQAMILLLDVLKTEELAESSVRLVEKLERAAGNLGVLLDQVLDYAWLTSGEISVVTTTIPLAPLVHRLWQGDVTMEIDNLSLASDPKLLEMALRPVMDNAIRQGSASFHCRRENGRLRIEIRDEGPGIPSEEVARIFDPFFQGESGTAGPGPGLGLATTRQATALLGGSIEVASAPGKGSCFCLDFPLAK